MAEILRIEHENEVLTQKLADAMAELEVWKRTATEYAGVVKEMRRDREELVGSIIDVFDDYIDAENAVIVGDDYDMVAEKITKILKGED